MSRYVNRSMLIDLFLRLCSLVLFLLLLPFILVSASGRIPVPQPLNPRSAQRALRRASEPS